jgi:pilus assembly protein CpaB
VSPARRRRGLLLLSLSLACGGLAASEVATRMGEVEARVGHPVPVVTARRDLAAGREIDPERLGGLLRVRQVPAAFAPRDGLADPREASGLAPAVPVAAGSFLTAGHFAASTGGRGERSLLRPGERAVEVAVAGGDALAATGPGGRVDVIVSSEPRTGAGSTFVALEGVELLALSPLAGGAGGLGSAANEGAAASATALATLRVSLRQAVYLTAAQNFAREVRLLARPPGDRGRSGRFGVSAAAL